MGTLSQVSLLTWWSGTASIRRPPVFQTNIGPPQATPPRPQRSSSRPTDLKTILAYPMTTGRSLAEILGVPDSVQVTASE